MTADHDPPQHERVYYRHIDTGQRAYVVTRAGIEKLRIDHGPNVETIIALDPTKWTVDKDVRPINANHLAEVAYVADRMLCQKLALFREAKLEWRDLTVAERQRFTTHGPGDEYPVRARLFAHITKGLAPYTSK
jgi:hypothetical protein